jgi:heme O synthase-like polyprenyltransferase
METVTKKNISKYIRLSKLRIVELLLITTVPSMIVSIYGFPPLELIVFTRKKLRKPTSKSLP